MISRPKKRAGERQSDAALFFSTPELAQRLDLLRHLVENSELIPLLRAEAGSGKTTMLFRLLSLAESNWVPCRVDANPMMHPDQLLQRLAACFGLLNEPEPDLQVVVQRARVLRGEGRLPVVMVDDAEQLPPETLITLLQLNEHRSDDVPVVSVLLFASPAIDDVLSSAQLQTMNLQVLHPLDIPRLRPAQIPRYVQHLLKVEGIKTDFLVEPAHVDKLFRESEGLPGRINSLIIKMLREPAANLPLKSEGIAAVLKGVLTPPRLGILAGVVALITAVLLFQDTINSLFGGGADRQGAPELASNGTTDRIGLSGIGEPMGDSSVVVPLELPPPAAGEEVPAGEATANVPPEVDGVADGGAMEEAAPASPAEVVEVAPAEEKKTAMAPPPEEEAIAAGTMDHTAEPQEESPAEKVETVVAAPAPEPKASATPVTAPPMTSEPGGMAASTVAKGVAPMETAGVAEEPPASKPQPGGPASKDTEPSAVSIPAVAAEGTTPVEERSTQVREEGGAPAAAVVSETVEAIKPKPAEKAVVEERGRDLLAARPPEKTVFKGPEVVEAAPPKKAQPRLSETPPKVPAKARQAVAPASAVKREAWLMQQNPRHYVLQVLAVGNEAALKKYIKTHGLEGKVAYFRSMRDGKPWYSLLYGLYPDRGAALAAKAHLPASIRKRGGWPRSLASVQAAIKNAR